MKMRVGRGVGFRVGSVIYSLRLRGGREPVF